jgi:hypothetical protein
MTTPDDDGAVLSLFLYRVTMNEYLRNGLNFRSHRTTRAAHYVGHILQTNFIFFARSLSVYVPRLSYHIAQENCMIRKLQDGRYRLYSRKKNPKTGKRRNLGTFSSRAAAEKHERAVQFFKRH